MKKCDKFIVRYYTDSLGLPRPNEVILGDRYIDILIEYWKSKNLDPFLLDRSRANYTIKDIYNWFKEDNKYYGKKVDVAILHEGVVDCAPRPIPNKIRRLISVMHESIKNMIIKFIHNNRSKMQKLGIKYYLTKPAEFYAVYKNMLQNLVQFSDKVYVINIAPANKKTEAHSPGFTKSIDNYNEIIKNIIYEIKIKTSQFSINDLVFESDGHHITPLCHKIIGEQITKAEKIRLNKQH